MAGTLNGSRLPKVRLQATNLYVLVSSHTRLGTMFHRLALEHGSTSTVSRTQPSDKFRSLV